MDLSVTTTGTGEDLVLLVHGVLDNERSFTRVRELLDGEGQVLSYDRRGYGRSVGAAGAPVEADGHIEDLLAVLDGRRAVVVGHSFGGVIAAGAAVRAPELVSALVLYESVMAWIPGWDDTRLRELLWSENPEDAGLELMFGDRYHAMSPEQRQRRRAPATAFVIEERSVRGEQPPYDLARLSMPVVYGYSDTFPAEVMPDYLRSVLPEVDLVCIEGGGHNAHRDAPEAFADLVRLGLRRAASTGRNR
jgi:pimeloyl-ACP methyl ester carboxylesterase